MTLPCIEPIEPVTERKLDELVENNIKIYEKYIQDAGEQKVDILVFPEATLNYCGFHNKNDARKHALVIPSVNDQVAPCNDDKQTVV